MGFIARLLMMMLMIGGVSFILYKIAIFFFGVQPTKSALKRDLKLIRTILDQLADELIPWDNDDLKLLSRIRSVKVSRSGLNKVISGLVQSIYYEPMLAYGFKTFSRGNKVGLLVIRSLNNEFIYQYSVKGIEVFSDNQHIGTIGFDNKLRSISTAEVLAKINDGLDLKSVYVGEKEVAVIKETLIDEDHAGRYFEYIDNLSNEERPLVLAMSLFELISSDMPK